MGEGMTPEEIDEILKQHSERCEPLKKIQRAKEAARKAACHCGGKGCPCCDGAGGFSNMPGEE